jgi:topoisomerase-4 subunit A
MARGAGVALQKFRSGGLADLKVFRLAEGLTWRLGDKTRTELALKDWIGARGQVGRMPPNGFPKSNRFS